MNEQNNPLISVVVATRNRGNSVLGTVQSVLASDYSKFEVRIIDQSSDDRCEAAIQRYLQDSRVHYRRIHTKGLASARNVGITDTLGEIIAITDDDCTVPINWLRMLLASAERDKRIGVIFGRVVAGPHDNLLGFIPTYSRETPLLLRRIDEKHQADGIGACMGLRKEVWKELGGFDEMLGVGAPLHANSEGDLVFRALRGGYFVYETPVFETTHHGFRTWEEGKELIQRYWYGTGALYAKHLKIAPSNTIGLLFSLAWRWAFGQSLVASSLGPNSRKMQRLMTFLRGFAAGVVAPVDRATGHFKVPQNK